MCLMTESTLVISLFLFVVFCFFFWNVVLRHVDGRQRDAPAVFRLIGLAQPSYLLSRAELGLLPTLPVVLNGSLTRQRYRPRATPRLWQTHTHTHESYRDVVLDVVLL